jgi:hypothetical protein
MIVKGSSSSLASSTGGPARCRRCDRGRCEKQVEMGDEAEKKPVDDCFCVEGLLKGGRMGFWMG